MIIQGSKEWHDHREGRFTGSEIHKLMGIKGVGKTGESYAFEKAVEIVFGRDLTDSYVSADMQRGNDLEPIAFETFKSIKALDFIEVSECSFFAYGDNAGASPDGLVGLNSVLEIKCPRPLKFFNLVANGIDAIDSDYIYQMQMEMLVTNSKECFFFNYIIYNGVPMWHEIVVQRDEAIIEKMKERINEAVLIRDKYVDVLMKNRQ